MSDLAFIIGSPHAIEEATNNHDHGMKGDGVHERWTALKENIGW